MTEDDAIALVKRFLRTSEARNLRSAKAMMAPNARITFPGGRVFASLSEMARASKSRYRWIKKTFDQAESFSNGEDFVVFVMGTLYGENRRGVTFSDVRYIDRFVIVDGKIAQQDVWNDLAESGVLERTTE